MHNAQRMRVHHYKEQGGTANLHPVGSLPSERFQPAELEAKLERSNAAVRGAALGSWADWIQGEDLSRSI